MLNESEERCVRIRITSGQPIWSVEVSDSGCGFKGDPMQYFRKGVTTKGEGHGYGLYLVARAVHAYNAPSKSRKRITLPAPCFRL